MPIGDRQTNDLMHLTLDVWQDSVFFNSTVYPAGYFASGIMNAPLDEMHALLDLSNGISVIAQRLYAASRSKLLSLLEEAKCMVSALFLEQDYLRRLRKRDETHFAIALHDCFNSELFQQDMQDLTHSECEPFDLMPTLRSSYIFARSPKNEKETVFVNHMLFERVVDFYYAEAERGPSGTSQSRRNAQHPKIRYAFRILRNPHCNFSRLTVVILYAMFGLQE